MEKKFILVGMKRDSAGFAFFNIVINKLSNRSIDVLDIDRIRFRFETPHIKVWFVDDYYCKYFLDGVRPDAIFGEHYPELLARAFPHTIISSRDHIGLVDYIYHVEREAALCKVGEDIDEHNDKLNSLYPKVWITTAGSQDSEFHKRFMNSIYGRQCGKTQACLKYLERELVNIPEKKIDFGGENNMTKIMNDIAQGKPVRLSTISGVIPVQIDTIETHMGEPTRFKGCVLTPAEDYMRRDIAGAMVLRDAMRAMDARRKLPGIKNVIFSGPCTIVIWEDKTKTVVRCNNDVLDQEKGLAMAIAKKAFGTNKSGSNYYDIFKKWLPKEDPMVIDWNDAAVVKYEKDAGVVLTPMEEK